MSFRPRAAVNPFGIGDGQKSHASELEAPPSRCRRLTRSCPNGNDFPRTAPVTWRNDAKRIWESCIIQLQTRLAMTMRHFFSECLVCMKLSWLLSLLPHSTRRERFEEWDVFLHNTAKYEGRRRRSNPPSKLILNS